MNKANTAVFFVFDTLQFLFAVNSTLVKQTLRVNNRSLAKALESVRRELKECQQEKLAVRT